MLRRRRHAPISQKVARDASRSWHKARLGRARAELRSTSPIAISVLCYANNVERPTLANAAVGLPCPRFIGARKQQRHVLEQRWRGAVLNWFTGSSVRYRSRAASGALLATARRPRPDRLLCTHALGGSDSTRANHSAARPTSPHSPVRELSMRSRSAQLCIFFMEWLRNENTAWLYDLGHARLRSRAHCCVSPLFLSSYSMLSYTCMVHYAIRFFLAWLHLAECWLVAWLKGSARARGSISMRKIWLLHRGACASMHTLAEQGTRCGPCVIMHLL